MEWLNINRMSTNNDKSKYMVFHAPTKETETRTFNIDNINIEKGDEFNIPGLTLDINLTWKIAENTSSCKQMYFIKEIKACTRYYR